VRRREVRFELINYLISHQLLDQARSELLVAPGNAPEDDISVQLDIARAMEQAQDPSDALHLYKTILHHHATLREALEAPGARPSSWGITWKQSDTLRAALEGPGSTRNRPRLSSRTAIALAKRPGCCCCIRLRD
jgi:hypothetical protein